MREYKLSPDQYLRSTRLREWARRNKNSKYIPEPLLEAWGFELSPTVRIPALAWAAAMVGHVDPQGQFHSAGFKTPVEFTDTIGLEEDLTPLYEAVTEALKKAAPKATVVLDASPAPNSGSEPKPS